MTKTVTHIDCPPEWESTNDWDSHLALIYLILKNNKECHPFAEFGSGNSTQIINEYCKANGIKFESYENDKEWCLIPSHYVDTYFNIDLLMGYILFIDGKPGEDRKLLIEKNKYKHILIAHDTEDGAEYVYGMKEVLSTFKYRLDYKPEGKPKTTAVSNTIDVTQWV